MGSVRIGAPRELALWIRDTFGIRTFVETGTNAADTAVWAAKEFDKVITIEGYEPLYTKAVAAYAAAHKNIEFILGDSREHIARLLRESLQTPAIFWLDAHWCGVETFGAAAECPVMEELKAVNTSNLPHFILIDDARFFLAPAYPPHKADHWPDIATVAHEVKNPPLNRYVVVHEDVIVGVPAEAREKLIKFMHYGPDLPPPPQDFMSKVRRKLKRITSAH